MGEGEGERIVVGVVYTIAKATVMGGVGLIEMAWVMVQVHFRHAVRPFHAAYVALHATRLRAARLGHGHCCSRRGGGYIVQACCTWK